MREYLVRDIKYKTVGGQRHRVGGFKRVMASSPMEAERKFSHEYHPHVFGSYTTVKKLAPGEAARHMRRRF